MPWSSKQSSATIIEYTPTDPSGLSIQKLTCLYPGESGNRQFDIVLNNFEHVDALLAILPLAKFELIGRSAKIPYATISIRPYNTSYGLKEGINELLSILGTFDSHLLELSETFLADASRLMGLELRAMARIEPSRSAFFPPETLPKEVSIPQSFLCPITLDVMAEPVLLTLDGRSYEKSAITTWLAERKSAPYNRKAMKPGQTIDTLLVPNRALADAIEEFKTTNPALFGGTASRAPKT